ncbi:MAG: DUF4384 domain-containing protein [Cyanobacteriota/Melainabacteria group bacterium]|nr:DUF4384 domain-containing protein [Candidatus Obscuribacterales bacterium]
MDNGLRKALTIGLVSLSFGITMLSPAVADDNKSSDEVSAPTKDELKNSTNRGLHIQPLKPKTTAKSKTLTVTDTKIQKESKVSKSTKTEKAVDVVPKKVVKSAPAKKPAVKTVTANKKSPPKKTVVASTRPALFVSSGNIVAASLNKAGRVPRYQDGEKLKVTVRAYEDCNLMIFNYDGKVLTQLFPNEYQRDSFIKAGARVEIGGEESKFDFCASNETGDSSSEKIFVYAYPAKEKAKPISIAMNKAGGTPFRSTEMSLEDYRKLVNGSQTFFSRGIKVMPKKQVVEATYEEVKSSAPPNKLELSLTVDGK